MKLRTAVTALYPTLSLAGAAFYIAADFGKALTNYVWLFLLWTVILSIALHGFMQGGGKAPMA